MLTDGSILYVYGNGGSLMAFTAKAKSKFRLAVFIEPLRANRYGKVSKWLIFL